MKSADLVARIPLSNYGSQVSIMWRLRRLGHETPDWVAADAAFFITMNTRDRGRNVLRRGSIAERLIESLRSEPMSAKMDLWVATVMPDHLHFIASFNAKPGMRRTIMDWKRFVARYYGVRWQSDYFDRRLRNATKVRRKTEYVLNNPVAAELVQCAEDWPYV